MNKLGSTQKKTRTKRPKIDVPFKGVRMRTWGTWVSEIRKPLSKERIWLGSFDAPEKAARAYDAALYCLRGSKGKFNFPGDERPEVPAGESSSLSTTEIKEVAAKFASPGCMSDLSSTSPLTMADTPGVEGGGTVSKRTFEIGDSPFGVDAKEHASMFSDSYLLDVPITHEPDSIWALLDEINQFNEAK